MGNFCDSARVLITRLKLEANIVIKWYDRLILRTILSIVDFIVIVVWEETAELLMNIECC